MKRITKQVLLGGDNAKFSINCYISGLSNNGNSRYGRSNTDTFAQTAQYFDNVIQEYNKAISASLESKGFSDRIAAYEESRKKYGFNVSLTLHPVIDQILEVMPYLRVLPYFKPNAVYTESEYGVGSVCFIHSGDDYPCGAITWEGYYDRWLLFCPLTSDVRNGRHFTESGDRLLSLARKYFKYRVPAKIAPYVAFSRASKSELEEKARDNSYDLRTATRKVNSYGGSNKISKVVYSLLRGLHDDGHCFGDGELNRLFDEITSRRADEAAYKKISCCIMYAKMRTDGGVDYAFYFAVTDENNYNDDPRALRYGANYDLCSAMHSSPMSGMPPEFIVPMSQLALEEPNTPIESTGIRINQYEYVLYSNGVENILDPEGMAYAMNNCMKNGDTR